MSGAIIWCSGLKGRIVGPMKKLNELASTTPSLLEREEAKEMIKMYYGFYNKISNNNQIDLIQSDKLQMKIIELYEQYYKRYNDLDLNIEHQNIFSLEINYFSKIRHLVSDNGWNDLTYDLIEEHYPILQDETRKINGLTYGTHDAMLNCKAQIELLLEDLRNVITE